MLMDNEWDLSKQFAFTSLVSPSNNCVVVAILYAILAIIFVTILADLLIVFRNKKAQKQM
jgi:subtilase family serine protease